jgi:NADH:ubiquinone oxidoreductase subunit 2 (subunit N)
MLFLVEIKLTAFANLLLILALACFFFLGVILFKLGLFPFFSWVPDVSMMALLYLLLIFCNNW